MTTRHPDEIRLDRRGWIHRAAVAMATLLAAASAARAAEHKPNVVLVLADDLGYGDVGAYGQKLVRTPHIDRFAAEGLRFTDFYATFRSPVAGLPPSHWEWT